MKNILIKIIKRKDVEAMANAKIQNADAPEPTVLVSEEKLERRSRREIIKTISNWIPERGKNNRVEELAAVRKFFGSELLSSKS